MYYFYSQDGSTVGTVALLALARVFGGLDCFLSRVSILTRDIDIANLSVRPSVRLSVRNVPVSDENGLTCGHSLFHHTVAQSF